MLGSVGFGDRDSGCPPGGVGPSRTHPVPQSPQLQDGLDHAAPAPGADAERSPRLLLCDTNLSF